MMEQTNNINYGYTPEQIKEMQEAFNSIQINDQHFYLKLYRVIKHNSSDAVRKEG